VLHACKVIVRDAAEPLPDSATSGLPAALVDFLRQALQRDADARPAASKLLAHPFFRDES
jgi:hypothetical protein